MRFVTSREYKVMLDPHLFVKIEAGLGEVSRDLQRVAGSLGAKLTGELDKVERRTIRFLDTPDSSLRKNALILRFRQSKGDTNGTYTLKCRTEDRYIASGRDISPAKKTKGKSKFEEDIAAPFRSRYSHSVTIDGSLAGMPDSVGNASRLFPMLAELPRDGGLCDSETPIKVVNDFIPLERVHKGLKLVLSAEVSCSVAVILWSHNSKGRVLCAEFSFRYEDPNENYPVSAAQTAYNVFTAIQSLDWCLPGASTKTQLAYQS